MLSTIDLHPLTNRRPALGNTVRSAWRSQQMGMLDRPIHHTQNFESLPIIVCKFSNVFLGAALSFVLCLSMCLNQILHRNLCLFRVLFVRDHHIKDQGLSFIPSHVLEHI